MRYVSLHTHSTFSYGDGYGTVYQHVSRVAELGMTALALTEHGNVSSWVQLEKACNAIGVKPIYGIEIYHAPPGPEGKLKCHMTLLAMNSVGLQNLNRIVTESWKTIGTTSFSRFPTVNWEILRKFNDGIVALSGCADSQLSCVLLGGKSYGARRLGLRRADLEAGARCIRKYQKVFGERFFLEVQRFPGLERTCLLNKALGALSSYTGTLLVATSDVHYPKPNQNEIQKILHASHRGASVESVEAQWEYDVLLTYPLSDKEIENDLVATGLSPKMAREAIDNTAMIAARCDEIQLPKATPPKFPHVGTSSEDVLRQWISVGWRKRLAQNDLMRLNKAKYAERVRHEYEIICARAGFADYFLIVADIVIWAKKQGIAVGPGRGSSAGSLVCYLLSITEIDSLRFPMLFERFLDPTRTDPPDIDVDFEDERRDEVFAYAARKYGVDMVANILTVTRYKGRNSLDDVQRAYGYKRLAQWKIDAIKDKLLERAEGHPRFAKSLMDTINSFPDIADLVAKNPEIRYATRLEGNVRSLGVHPAGLVISSVPLETICATYEKRIGGTRGGTGNRSGSSSARGSGKAGRSRERQGVAIAFDKYDAAYLGLLKMDFLSLSTLSCIAEMCRLAGVPLEKLYRISLEDKKILQRFTEGDVLGIFQFEGLTQRRVLKDVAPQSFQELCDVNALSRPGGQDTKYVTAKKMGLRIALEHSIIEEHLNWTYGVVVYEEQILMILRDLGGFAPQELNRMRKIIHDKLGGTAFNEYYSRFVKGAATHGLSENAARAVWEGLVAASGYAFNVAHAVSYTHIGWWTMYFKTYHPTAFYAGLLIRCDDDVRRAKIIAAAKLAGIEVVPPKLLISQDNWMVDATHNRIIAGFNVIPGLGPKRIAAIINWRESYGPDGGWGFGLDWADLQEIDGIGPKTIATIEDFVNMDDPFKTGHTQELLDKVRNWLREGDFPEIPTPTHRSVDIPTDGKFVVYLGLLRKRKYYDAAEQLTKKEINLDYEEARNRLKDKHLLKYCALYCEDEHGEQVRVAVSRWKFPHFAERIDSAKIDRSVVVAEGVTSDFQGISVQVKRIWVVNK